MLSLGGDDSFILDTRIICDVTPTVTLTDSAAVNYVLMKDNGTVQIPMTQPLVDRWQSSVYGCFINSFDLLDDMGASLLSSPVTFVENDPLSTSEIGVDTSQTIDSMF